MTSFFFIIIFPIISNDRGKQIKQFFIIIFKYFAVINDNHCFKKYGMMNWQKKNIKIL